MKIMYHWDLENPKTYNNKMGYYKTLTEMNFIEKYVKAPMDILDIGGGSGRFAIPLIKSGNNVTIIDKSPEAQKIALERFPEIDYKIGDFMELELDYEKCFDIILSIEVLLYINDLKSYFNKIHRLLRNNGLFIFSVTNGSSWRYVLRRIKEIVKLDEDYHYTILSHKNYLSIIKECKFKIEDVNGFLWALCSYNSNSFWVNIYTSLEKVLKLDRYISQSPWLLYAVKKD